MGTIVARQRKDGTTAYLAKISITLAGEIAHRENKTFDRKPAAAAWIAKRESELMRPGALEQERAPSVTLAAAIDRYTEDSLKEIGRTKTQVLRAIKGYRIADMACHAIASPDIVAFARDLNTTMKPQTAGNYLSHLSAVFAIAQPAWGYPLDRQAMTDALIVAKRLGLVTRSRERDRRPTLPEIEQIMTHFEEITRRRPSSNPMHRIVAFAIFSTRRQDEITRIRWEDLDEQNSRVLVRDMKNPGEKIGNDVWCDLPAPALEIIKAMPRVGREIFPYGTDAISASFTRACALLGIEDLHFHDLRHDGVSRLFELGLNIPHAAAVSGHRSWKSLQRYTHVRQAGDKYAGWRWHEIVTAPMQHSDTRLRGRGSAARARTGQRPQ
jgi:integrase